MFEELIKEIESLKHAEDFEDVCATDLINRIIGLVKEAEPPILDKPDSEGWWWYKTEYGDLYAVCISGNKVYDPHHLLVRSVDEFVELYGGTWQKDIMPSMCKDNDELMNSWRWSPL